MTGMSVVCGGVGTGISGEVSAGWCGGVWGVGTVGRSRLRAHSKIRGCRRGRAVGAGWLNVAGSFSVGVAIIV